MSGAGTLSGLLSSLAERHGDKAALVEPSTGGAVTFAELDEKARRAAAGLAAIGVARGDRVVVWLPNLPEWLVLQFAAARLGAVVVAVNTRFRAGELGGILRLAAASCLVMPTAFRHVDFAGILAEALEGVEAPPATVVVDTGAAGGAYDPGGGGHGPGDGAAGGALTWERLLSHPPMDAEAGRPEDVSNIFSTSGSTGRPKLAMHRQSSVVTHARCDAAAFDMRPGDVSLVALPLCGVFGFSAAMSALAAGSTMVLPDAFEPAAAARAIARYGVTHWHAADNMIRGVLAAADELSLRLDTWREGVFASFSGGGPELVREVERATGARITGVYGASELFALVSRWPREWSAEDRGVCGGFPVSGDIAVRAATPETGEVLPHGEPGELQFRGYNVTAGYFGDDAATAAAFTDDGWYRSGDLGSTRADGAFVYLARLKDSLRLRGFLTDPVEIEEHLQSHPAVALAQVVGVPGPGGDVAVAFVEPRPGAAADPGELVEHCRRHLADYKVPAAVHLVADWPTVEGTNGVKIQKMRLRDRAVELMSAAAD